MTLTFFIIFYQSDYGEQGELLVRIDNADALGFDGYYKNEGATKKKILTNVLEKGDAYFRSGDLLQMDRDGFYFFGDRVGDTFRWKVISIIIIMKSKPVDWHVHFNSLKMLLQPK